MELKPQDVVVALKLCVLKAPMPYVALGKSLGISASESHAAVRRLKEAGLIAPDSKTVNRAKLRNFIVHGVPCAFPAKTGEITRGIPTAWAAPVMLQRIAQSDQPIPVWPDADGKTKGVAVKPLYGSVVMAAATDKVLYDLLALVDAIRIGRARDRNIAEEELTARLKEYGGN
ncbi:MAG TPA: Lrp/AsnC family transcriptional regulator [Candidatus Paceibacterota bacterium]|nr:Lrp/AsnC family transcriptional regulator [Candidatus Paceibacterota bacterium]